MSVLIKGMKMPEKCGSCDLFHVESPMHCTVVKGHKTVGAPYGMPRPDWCPLVEIPEPKEGHWIDKGWNGDWAWQIDGRGNCWRVIECSECGKSVSVESNYCPHCGADMRGEQHG